MKRRSLTVLLCLLAIISLASVGFASWVISAGDEEIATGNIQVEDVSDQRLEITNVNLSNKDFVFTGKPEEPTATESWLKYSGKKTEVLSSVLTFKVAFKGSDTVVVHDTNATITVNWHEDTQKVLEDAVEAGYIKAVPTLKLVDKGNGEYSVTIEFQWGTKFGATESTVGQNPFDYFNGKKVNDLAGYKVGGVFQTTKPEGTDVTYTEVTWGDYASETMSALYDYFTTNNSYTIEIEAQPKNA